MRLRWGSGIDSTERLVRLLPIAADVAGYSRLMGLDEVGTARARSANTTWSPMLFWQSTGVAS
jgi:hypothetical protein